MWNEAWKRTQQEAASASVGGEGYLRMRPGETVLLAIASPATGEGPWLRDQVWPDGAQSAEIYEYGKGPGGAQGYIELPVAVYDAATKEWLPKLMDEPLRRASALLSVADGKENYVFKVERSNIQKGKRQIGILTAEAVKEYGDNIKWEGMVWPRPKGKMPGQESQQPRPVEPSRGLAKASTDDMPF